MNINFGNGLSKEGWSDRGIKRWRNLELHAITDDCKPVEELARAIIAIQNEVDYIHIRERSKSAADILKLLGLMSEGGVDKRKLVMNGRVDIALFLRFIACGIAAAFHQSRSEPDFLTFISDGPCIHWRKRFKQKRKTQTTCCSAMCLKQIAKGS